MRTSQVSEGRGLATRRGVLGGSAAAIAAGVCGTAIQPMSAFAEAESKNVLGPRAGYSPMIGMFVSQLTWMREENGILRTTEKLSQADLDYLFDKNANSIGALMLHLAAAEKYYSMNTFGGMKWGTWSDAIKKQWDAALDLGDAGRAQIKGHERQYYVDILHEVREEALGEFKKRDDKWLLATLNDPDWGGPVNNLAKWFHVCEHEAHHTGQVAMMRKRLPGAKGGSEG